MTLKDYVNFKLTHADKTAEAEGYPLTMQNCKKNKKMKQLELYGNTVQDGTPTPDNPIEVESVGELVTDVNDINYGKYKIPVVQRGINLFSMAKAGFTEKTVNGITFTPLDDERIHIKGKIADSSSDAIYNPPLKFKIPIEKGIYNVKPYSGIGTIMFRADKDQSDTFLVNINATNTNTNVKEDAYISRIHIQINATSTKEWDDIVPIQLTKGTGTKSLPYEPYIEPTTTNIFLDEPLRKIGDYADYVDFKENKVIRSVLEKQLLSSEPRTVGRGCVCYLSADIVKPYSTTSIGNIFCTHYQRSTWAKTMQPSGTSEAVCINSSANSIGFYDSKYAYNLTAFKNFLDANTLMIYVCLLTPTEETITLDLPKLTAKTTIIEVDTSLAPSNIYGKYIKR